MVAPHKKHNKKVNGPFSCGETEGNSWTDSEGVSWTKGLLIVLMVGSRFGSPEVKEEVSYSLIKNQNHFFRRFSVPNLQNTIVIF